MDDVPAREWPEQYAALAHPKVIQRVRLVAGCAAQHGALVHAGGVRPVGKAHRLGGWHQHAQLVRHQHIDGVRTAQLIALQPVIVAIRMQIKEQAGKRSNARAFANTTHGGVAKAHPIFHGLKRVHQRQPAIIVKMPLQLQHWIARAQRRHTCCHTGRRSHAHRIR